MRVVRISGAAVLAAIALLTAGCGAGRPKPQTTLDAFTAAWSRGDWSAMRGLVADPPADFTSANASVFSGLGVTRALIGPGAVALSDKDTRASAPVTEQFTLPTVGRFTMQGTVELALAHDRWRVQWSPQTIESALHAGESIAAVRSWPVRAPILGAGGARLTTDSGLVSVGVVGGRVKDAGAVLADLVQAGAPRAAAAGALALAKAHPSDFEPVFTVSAKRFTQLKAAAGPANVYAVPGTEFRASSSETAITRQLAAHLVGGVGPITAAQLKSLGSPYTATSIVGQTGLQASQERTLAGTPTTEVNVVDSGGNPITRLATYPGHPGRPVRTSIDPRVQRAAETALASSTRPDVSMVAIRASTGQVLAAVSNPISTYDTALQGAYPPGSTFKVLTSTALFRRGLTPSSSATCPNTISVDGESFHNAGTEAAVSNITEAFTESCNTAFIGLAAAHLAPGDYPAAARVYGLQRTPQMGVPAFLANVRAPSSRTELAADAIGQGDITFSALGMASVAAAVDSGVVRAPRLVTGAADDRIPTTRVPAAIASDLRGMMADVVASGTASGVGLPAGTHAKTGTAEYGTGPEADLKIDGWLMGYDGDIAFAMVTQNTGGPDGGPVDGPIIAKFLEALGPSA